MKPYLEMWKHGVDFKGRTSRTDFWFAWLINVAFMSLLIIIGLIFLNTSIESGITRILAFYILIAAIPEISMSVRRLHDAERSGAMLLLTFVPFGAFILLYFYCQPAKEGFNKMFRIESQARIRIANGRIGKQKYIIREINYAA